jgi:hypothetical protein
MRVHLALCERVPHVQHVQRDGLCRNSLFINLLPEQLSLALRKEVHLALSERVPPRSFLQTRATREKIDLPQFIYSTAPENQHTPFIYSQHNQHTIIFSMRIIKNLLYTTGTDTRKNLKPSDGQTRHGHRCHCTVCLRLDLKG